MWTREGNTFKAHAVQIGMSDGMNTEILGGIKRGMEVVTDAKALADDEQSEAAQQQGESSPFAPKGPRGNKKK